PPEAHTRRLEVGGAQGLPRAPAQFHQLPCRRRGGPADYRRLRRPLLGGAAPALPPPLPRHQAAGVERRIRVKHRLLRSEKKNRGALPPTYFGVLDLSRLRKLTCALRSITPKRATPSAEVPSACPTPCDPVMRMNAWRMREILLPGVSLIHSLPGR